MKVTDLHALIVLRNHAQAILNGARADLKLSKEDKSSLMNGLKKVDDLFIKNFENCVDSLSVVTKSRTWVSTESEEDVLGKAMSLNLSLAAVDNASSDAKEALDAIVINKVEQEEGSKGAVVASAGSEVKTIPIVPPPSESQPAKKTKKGGFNRV